MGEIRFVGTGETRGYPYLVCKKRTGTRGYPYPVCKKLPFAAPELCLHCLHHTLKQVSGLQRVKRLN